MRWPAGSSGACLAAYAWYSASVYCSTDEYTRTVSWGTLCEISNRDFFFDHACAQLDVSLTSIHPRATSCCCQNSKHLSNTHAAHLISLRVSSLPARPRVVPLSTASSRAVSLRTLSQSPSSSGRPRCRVQHPDLQGSQRRPQTPPGKTLARCPPRHGVGVPQLLFVAPQGRSKRRVTITVNHLSNTTCLRHVFFNSRE